MKERKTDRQKCICNKSINIKDKEIKQADTHQTERNKVGNDKKKLAGVTRKKENKHVETP